MERLKESGPTYQSAIDPYNDALISIDKLRAIVLHMKDRSNPMPAVAYHVWSPKKAAVRECEIIRSILTDTRTPTLTEQSTTSVGGSNSCEDGPGQ